MVEFMNGDFQKEWEAERGRLLQVLKKYGVEIQRPRLLSLLFGLVHTAARDQTMDGSRPAAA
jgi:hypothetical protein